MASDGRHLTEKDGGGWAPLDLGKEGMVKGKEAVEALFGKELGRIEFDVTNGKLKLINRGVELSTLIMGMGHSTKRDDPDTIGGHGEVSLELPRLKC